MPTGQTWANIHKICIEEVLQICENELQKGPRTIFRDPLVGWCGNLQRLQMFEYLRELIEDTEDQLQDLDHRDLSDARFYCGAESIYSVALFIRLRPLMKNFLDHREEEFTGVLKQWVKNVNRELKSLEDPEAIGPWYIIRYVLSFYINESKKIMKIHEEEIHL